MRFRQILDSNWFAPINRVSVTRIFWCSILSSYGCTSLIASILPRPASRRATCMSAESLRNKCLHSRASMSVCEYRQLDQAQRCC